MANINKRLLLLGGIGFFTVTSIIGGLQQRWRTDVASMRAMAGGEDQIGSPTSSGSGFCTLPNLCGLVAANTESLSTYALDFQIILETKNGFAEQSPIPLKR